MAYTHSLPIGTILKGNAYTYTIDKVLGQGSFGITYLATTMIQGPLGKVKVPVALKEFYAKELDSRQKDGVVTARTMDGVAFRYAKAFRRESENLSKMEHPGIVNVLESFEANGTFYYSMEYLSGGSLDGKVKGAGIPEKEALPLVKQIGEALSYMHGLKMMHLDLKPKNVMLNGDGTPVVIDFGLSKQYDENGEPESSSTIGLGTPGYAPLEQAAPTSSLFQPTLDVYALGATLFKMLTGKTLPDATIILNRSFPADELKAKGVSESTIDAIRQAMSPLVSGRPQTIDAFLSLLDAPERKVEEKVEDSGEETKIAGGESSESGKPEKSGKPAEVVSGKPDSNNRSGENTNRFNGAAIFILVLDLLGCLLAIFLCGEGIMDSSYYEIDPSWMICSGICALLALIGIVLVFRKRKLGFWLFLAGGILCLLLAYGAFQDQYGTVDAFWGFLVVLLFADFLTFSMLYANNKHGISGWTLLH